MEGTPWRGPPWSFPCKGSPFWNPLECTTWRGPYGRNIMVGILWKGP